MEVLRRCPLAFAQRLVHCAIALSTAVLDRVTKTMSVAPLLMNNLDNSKQKTSNLLSPAPPPYSWSLLGKSEGPAPPPSSKISWSFDLAWSPDGPCGCYLCFIVSSIDKYSHVFHVPWVAARTLPGPPPPPPVVTDEVTVTKLFAVSNPGFLEISSSKRDWRMRGSSNRDAKIWANNASSSS